MLKKIKKLLYNELFQWIIIPSISVFFLVKCKLEPMSILNNFGKSGRDIYNYLKLNDYLFNFNISVWLIIINAIVSFLFRNFPTLRIRIRDKYMQEDNTFLFSPNSSLHLPKIYQCEIYLDYGSRAWFKIIKLFKGINIELILPSWVDVELNKIWEIGNCRIEHQKIIIPIGELITSSKLKDFKGELYIGFSLLSRKTCHDKEKIEVVIKSLKDRIFYNYVIKKSIFIDYVEHTIQTSE